MTEPTAAAQVLVTFGGLFLIGLLADLAGRHTPLPRVTLLLMSGFLIGPSVLDWLPSFTADWFPVLTNFALAMIGFLLG